MIGRLYLSLLPPHPNKVIIVLLLLNRLEILDNNFSNVDELNSSSINGTVFNEFLSEKAAVIGEKIVMRRFEKYSAGNGEIVNGYLHVNGKIGVLLNAKYDGDNKDKALEVLKNISMHLYILFPDWSVLRRLQRYLAIK